MIIFPLQRDLIINANHRLHWRRKAEKTAAIRSAARRAAGRPGLVIVGRVDVIVTYYYPGRRPRDAENLAPTTKAIIDGLTDAGLWPDDSDRYLGDRITRIAKHPGIANVEAEITFRPAQDRP